MRAVRVIPCLDVDAGRVVKGVRFVDLVDAGDPVELAARYDAEGADELVFLDITASAHERDTMVDVVSRTAEEVFIPFTVGGGVRAPDDARRLLRAGADKVALNTAAVLDPGLVAAAGRRVRLAVRRRRHRRPPAGVGDRDGRSSPTAGATRRATTPWPGPSECAALGAGEILLTSMDRDGTRDGLRRRAHARHRRRRRGPRGGVGRGGHPRAPRGGGDRGRRRRRAGGVDLPPPGVHRGRGEGVPRRARGRGAPSGPPASSATAARGVAGSTARLGATR